MTRNKILVVEDDLESLKTFYLIFEKYLPEYILFQVNDSTKALDIARFALPDLIITDWDMPILNGIGLIRQLKEDAITAEIPIIMATGVMITSDNLKTALEAGAIDYIRKPLDPVEVTARTHSALMIAEYHKKAIESKNIELAENALSLIRINEFINKVAHHIEEMIKFLPKDVPNNKEYLRNVLSEINDKMRQDSWQKFNLSFDRVHHDFHKNILIKHPDLTPSELKLCALISLGMNTKDIASILYLNPDSVKVARSRLRSRLGLVTEQNLEAYFNSI